MTNQTLSPRWQAYNLIDKYYNNDFADDIKNVIVNTPAFDRSRNIGKVISLAKRTVMMLKHRQLHAIRQFEKSRGIK